MIYLDFAASTPVKSEVIDTITEVLKNNYGNPSSIYEYGMESKKIIENSREIVRKFINAGEKDHIIFTSGACEGNSTIIKGSPWNYPILTTLAEHISTLNAVKSCGYDVEENIVNIDALGQVKLDDLDEKLKKNKLRFDFRPIFFCVSCNNEIGVRQNINKIQEIVHENNGLLAIDGTQHIPYYPIDVQKSKIDFLTFSGQKFGCPKGIGVLYIKDGIKIYPLIEGSQEDGYRGGTENVAYIAGLAKAIELIDYSKSKDIEYLRDYCWGELCKIADNHGTKFVLNGDPLHRLCNNLNFQVPCLDSQQIVALMDLNDIYISSGSACKSYEKQPSHVLKAIGLSDEEANKSIRVTLGEETTKEEISEFIKNMNFILDQFL